MKIEISSHYKNWLLIDILEYYGQCGNFDLKFVWFRIISDAFIGNGNKIHWEFGIALINDFYGKKFRWLFNKGACDLRC